MLLTAFKNKEVLSGEFDINGASSRCSNVTDCFEEQGSPLTTVTL